MSDRESAAEKTAIAAHLYITLRRKLNRVIDVEWLVRNGDYAREIITLARKCGLEELSTYNNRLEELMFGKQAAASPPVPRMEKAPELEEIEELANTSQYIGTLR